MARRAGGGKRVAGRESPVFKPLPRRRSRRTGGVDAKHRGWETRDTGHGTLAIGQECRESSSPLPATPYSPQSSLRSPGGDLKTGLFKVLPQECSDKVLPLDRAKRGSLGTSLSNRRGGSKQIRQGWQRWPVGPEGASSRRPSAIGHRLCSRFRARIRGQGSLLQNSVGCWSVWGGGLG